MRRSYGGKVSEIVRDLAREPEIYGPGWNCNVFKAGDAVHPAGVTIAERLFSKFLDALPLWSNAITTFLAACRYIGKHADPYRGVVFSDPSTGQKPAGILFSAQRKRSSSASTGSRRCYRDDSDGGRTSAASRRCRRTRRVNTGLTLPSCRSASHRVSCTRSTRTSTRWC